MQTKKYQTSGEDQPDQNKKSHTPMVTDKASRGSDYHFAFNNYLYGPNLIKMLILLIKIISVKLSYLKDKDDIT